MIPGSQVELSTCLHPLVHPPPSVCLLWSNYSDLVFSKIHRNIYECGDLPIDVMLHLVQHLAKMSLQVTETKSSKHQRRTKAKIMWRYQVTWERPCWRKPRRSKPCSRGCAWRACHKAAKPWWYKTETPQELPMLFIAIYHSKNCQIFPKLSTNFESCQTFQ